MSTAFLQGYARAVVRGLLDQGLVEVTEGGLEQAVSDVVEFLVKHGKNRSAIGLTGQALLSSSAVEELFATDEQIKAIVDNLSG